MSATDPVCPFCLRTSCACTAKNHVSATSDQRRDAEIAELRAKLAEMTEARDWEASLKAALLPYQERAVTAEKALAASEAGAAALRMAIVNASRLPERCYECGGTTGMDCTIVFRCPCGETQHAPSPETHLPDVDAGKAMLAEVEALRKVRDAADAYRKYLLKVEGLPDGEYADGTYEVLAEGLDRALAEAAKGGA